MRLIISALLFSAFSGMAWDCPDCGADNQGSYCTVCHLPEPPAGMVFVPACSVVTGDDTVHVSRFFIDESPVSYRSFLPWLNNSGFGVRELGVIITGGGDDSMEFLAFTPFIGDPSGGITVPSRCLENAAASITWNGSQSYLSDRGKRLPTLGEIHAANQAGILTEIDVYQAMLAYSDQLRASMGDMLGMLGTQAMFAGYSTARERVMWELTGTVYGGNPVNTAPAGDVIRVTIFKPGNPPELSFIDRNDGYFNVVFRGAIQVPE